MGSKIMIMILGIIAGMFGQDCAEILIIASRHPNACRDSPHVASFPAGLPIRQATPDDILSTSVHHLSIICLQSRQPQPSTTHSQPSIGNLYPTTLRLGELGELGVTVISVHYLVRSRHVADTNMTDGWLHGDCVLAVCVPGVTLLNPQSRNKSRKMARMSKTVLLGLIGLSSLAPVAALMPMIPPRSPAASGKTCTLIPKGAGQDDVPQILEAFEECNNGGTVVFPENSTFYIATVLNPVIYDVTVDWKGTWLV